MSFSAYMFRRLAHAAGFYNCGLSFCKAKLGIFEETDTHPLRFSLQLRTARAVALIIPIIPIIPIILIIPIVPTTFEQAQKKLLVITTGNLS